MDWTVIKIGIANGRHFSSFHVQGVLSHADAVAHALKKINADWDKTNNDYLINCIELGNYTVTTETK